jgi:hypothetical protein
VLSLFHTLCNSLQHVRSVLSELCLHQSSGNCSQRQTFQLPLGYRTIPVPQPQQFSTNSTHLLLFQENAPCTEFLYAIQEGSVFTNWTLTKSGVTTDGHSSLVSGTRLVPMASFITARQLLLFCCKHDCFSDFLATAIFTELLPSNGWSCSCLLSGDCLAPCVYVTLLIAVLCKLLETCWLMILSKNCLIW